MPLTCVVKAKKVPVIRYDNAIVVHSKVKVIDVVGAEKTGAGGRGHVYPAPDKAVGDGRIHMLVKVKPDGAGHSVLPTCF